MNEDSIDGEHTTRSGEYYPRSLLFTALRGLLAISFFEGVSHLFSKITSFDMRVVLPDYFFGVIKGSGSGCMP